MNDEVVHTHKNPIVGKVIQAHVGKYGITEENAKFLHTQPVDVVKKVLMETRKAQNDDDLPAYLNQMLLISIETYVDTYGVTEDEGEFLKEQPTKIVHIVLPKILEHYGKCREIFSNIGHMFVFNFFERLMTLFCFSKCK
jgi:hypothetical protein